MKKIIILFIIIFTLALLFRNDISAFVEGDARAEKNTKDKNQSENAGSQISIKQKWELPQILLEISGLAYMDTERFACVQDEAGTIYIYNIKTATIEKEIPFTGAGDFEGIALKGNTAYIVRSDGVIFEVDMATKKTNEYETFLTAADNIETLFYDDVNNRLLLSGKEADQSNAAAKNIYAFDLASKKLSKTPIVTIDLSNELFANSGKSTKKKKLFMPSGLAIHPATKDIYILDGPKSRMLVTSSTGAVKKLYDLGKEFFKPEGISFSKAGDLFISNEGKKIREILWKWLSGNDGVYQCNMLSFSIFF